MLTPKAILLIDAVGALVTSVTMAFLFWPEVIATGMPPITLIWMAFAAACFSAVGLIGYNASNSVPRMLLLLAILNVSFCLVSLTIWLLNFERLTVFGYVYFPAEIILILGLVAIELRGSQIRRS